MRRQIGEGLAHLGRASPCPITAWGDASLEWSANGLNNHPGQREVVINGSDHALPSLLNGDAGRLNHETHRDYNRTDNHNSENKRSFDLIVHRSLSSGHC